MYGEAARGRALLYYSLLASLCAASGSLLARRLWSVQPLPEIAMSRIVQLMPPGLFEWGIQTMGGAAKALLFAILVSCEVAVLALIGYLWLRRVCSPPSTGSLGAVALRLVGPRIRGVRGVGSPVAVLLVLVCLLSVFALGALLILEVPSSLLARAARGPVLTYALWAAGLYVARQLLLAAGRRPDASRRLALASGAWGILTLLGLGGSVWALLGRSTLTRLGWVAGRTPAITSTPRFYLVSKNVLDPTVDAVKWRLRVDGNVRHPLTYTLDELRALPVTEHLATMECISNPVGGNLISTASWKGVRLSELLDRAGVRAGAYDVVTMCADGYTESLPVSDARAPEVLLVFEMNGEPLVQKHGAPVRLQVPGLYGLKSSKWVERIRVVNEDYLGYWQKEANWTDGGAVYMGCRIDHPPNNLAPREGMLLTGVAYTGTRGVSRVEVSVDDGQTWQEATLEPALGKLTWRRWSYPWRPGAPGLHTVAARTYDGAGNAQEERPFFPGGRLPMEGVQISGSAGIHRLNLTVLDS